ncbi:MAG: response regulator [Lachnospiraceae bacterium]|nr:response regulator [Lachnospiraceae bacterium]
MYKVVIIDDEPIIVEGLSRAVDWSRWDCRVAGFAYNGKEGLDVIRKERPNILISDIRMPEIDGLTMVAALKSEFPHMQISILTGYRNFEYAKKAIELGVTRFLLKPSKLDELEEAIVVMKKKLDDVVRVYPELISDTLPSPEGEEDNGEELEDSPASSFIVHNAIEYIKEHYADKLRLSDVADEIYVSQWHLSKLINKHTGSNFSEILNGIRIEKAKQLLKDPALKIYDIAEQVGFSDLTHFSRVFKKLEGISANEYRNKI